MGCHRDLFTIVPKHIFVRRTAKIDGSTGDCLKYRLNVSCRTADHFEHICGGGLLPEGFTQFVQQARVLDGDDGLRGEVLYQLDLFVRKGMHLLAVDRNRSNERILLKHWHNKKRTAASKLDHGDGNRFSFPICLFLCEVRDLH